MVIEQLQTYHTTVTNYLILYEIKRVKMKILFIVIPYLIKQRDAKNSKTRSFVALPYGLLSIATYLKNRTKNKVDIKIIDCNLYENYKQVISQSLLDFKPDIAGLSMMFDSSYKYLKDVSKIIKENNEKTVVVLGGASASLSYETIINEQNYIDGICYSEGEKPFLRIINSRLININKNSENSNINIIHHLENDKSWITKESLKKGKIPEKSVVEDLNEVIDIDYTYVNIKEYQMREGFSPFFSENYENKRQFFLATSRGCPYNCIFCSNSINKKVRYASIDKIIEHIKYLISNYGMNVLTITDDQLLSNKERAKELFRQLTQFNLRIECPNGLSAIFIDDEMAYLMKKAGMDTAVLAIESGSDYMLKEVIHKPLKVENIKSAVEILKKCGFFIEGFFVVGIPGEKEEHRNETLSLIKDVELDWSVFSVATPWRGSRLYNICIKNGYIDKSLKIGEIEIDKYIIKTPDLDPEYINKKTYLMNLDVNFVNNYRMKIGDYQIAANCFQDIIKGYKNHAFAYYYLSKAQEAMNEDPEIIKINKDKFYEIIREDSIWKEYAEYFKLD